MLNLKSSFLLSSVASCFLASSAFASYHLCNYSSRNVDVAFAFVHPEQPGNWVSAGWQIVNSGSCAKLINYDLTKMFSRIYYHAIANDGSGVHWSGNQNFCVKVGQPFTIFRSDSQCGGGTFRSFRMTNVPVGQSDFTTTIYD